MRHAYMYNGAFELNHSALTPQTSTYRTTEGNELPLPSWPEEIDGVRIGYMEKSGKKFYAVRIQYGDHDIVLEHPVYIDPLRHMNNRRFSAGATVVTDDEASALLDDVIRDNPGRQPELAQMINRINQTRRESREKSQA